MAAIAYWEAHDPEVLALLETYHAARDLQPRFARYQAQAERALAPGGGLWPADAVNVRLERDGWASGDVGAAVAEAAAFWHSLVANRAG